MPVSLWYSYSFRIHGRYSIHFHCRLLRKISSERFSVPLPRRSLKNKGNSKTVLYEAWVFGIYRHSVFSLLFLIEFAEVLFSWENANRYKTKIFKIRLQSGCLGR